MRVILLFPGTVTLIKYVAASRTLPHSSFSNLIIFHAPFLAGDIGQMYLPAGMQDLNLSGYGMKITGKRLRRRVTVEQLPTCMINYWAVRRTRFLIPHLIRFPLCACPPARCCRQALAPRGHAECELRDVRGHHRYG